MNKIMILLAATTAATFSVPAAAQYRGGDVQFRVDQLRMEIQRGVQSGEISRAEAIPLREQLRQLVQLERRYGSNGINGRERADLQHRINRLRQSIRIASRDYQGRYDPYDRNDRYDRDDHYDRDHDRYEPDDDWDDRDGNRDGRWDVESRNDGDRDGWDDRDDDRDGRWDDDDDRYDPDRITGDRHRGLIGNVIDSVIGRDGLRVGQQASANLGPVPYAYQSQFRDGNGVYYRSDGRHIYQVDARTHVVARIFAMNR